MRVHTFVIIAALITSTAALPSPTDAAQRQRSPGQSQGNGGNGGGGGQNRAGERRAEPRNGGGRRESGGGERQQSRAAQPPRQERQERRQQQARQQPQERQQPELRQQPQLRRQPENRQQPDLRQSSETRSGVRDRGAVDDGRRGDRNRSDRDRNWEGGSVVRPRVAVPRQGPPPVRDANRNGYRVYRPGGRTYNYYNYYPRSLYYRSYQFGYGPAGRGYFYFDGFYNSYVFYPRTVIRYDTYGTYGYPTGELRLQVRPRDAQVFIDGYYAGTVDQFDGIFQSLRLEDGDYHVEIVLPGYEALDFDVRILPGEKVTYRGDLLPELP